MGIHIGAYVKVDNELRFAPFGDFCHLNFLSSDEEPQFKLTNKIKALMEIFMPNFKIEEDGVISFSIEDTHKFYNIISTVNPDRTSELFQITNEELFELTEFFNVVVNNGYIIAGG